jgi:glutamate racemase
MQQLSPIGVFDSGLGGLTVLREMVRKLGEYDFIYLGDNARAPYGTKDFDTVYKYTLEAVRWLFEQGCPLVILACNTASSKALRTIQQKDLPQSEDPTRRVLGVIRPTTEVIGDYSQTGHIGILGTTGTVESRSYPIEIARFFPDQSVYQQACPDWVPLVESGQYLDQELANPVIRKELVALISQQDDIDTVLLACTHYPLLYPGIRAMLPPDIEVVTQGEIVADSLVAYLKRRLDMEKRLSKGGQISFYTSGDVVQFEKGASIFWGEPVQANHTQIGE